jgi:hypothetical protein
MPSFSRIGDDDSCTCKAGETLMGTSCQPCEKGKWKSSIGVSSCSRCENTLRGAITARNGSTTESACICPPRTYDDGKGSCVPVEEGMRKDLSGMTLASLTLEEGFWRTSEKSDDVRACITPEACVGGIGDGDDVCREGHTGPYCALCKDNYNLDPFMLCKECSSSTLDFIFTLVAFVALALGLFGLNYLVKKKLDRRGARSKEVWKRCKNGLKILFASGQITASLPNVVPQVSLPENFKDVVFSSQFLNFNLFTLVPMGCFAGGGFNFYVKCVALTMSVIVVCATLSLLAFFKRRPNLYTAAIAITYLTLPTITTTVFGMFPCDEFDNNKSRLRGDLSIDCKAGGRGAWEAFGYLMVGIYPVGVPLMYWVLLYRMKDRLMGEDRINDEKLRGILFLWEPYKKEYWWWEVFETVRRLAMTGLLSTVDPGSFTQITAGSMMATLYTIYLACAFPFDELRDNIIAILSGILLILTFLSAFLVKSQKLVEDDYEAVGLGAILIAALVLIIVLFFAWAWYSFNDLNESNHGMAARAFQSSIGQSSVGSRRSWKTDEGGGVEMRERRGSSNFSSENPMRAESEAVGGGSVEKKEGKSLYKRFEDEMLRRSYERQLRNNPVNTRVVRQQQYEDPIPGPPPPRSQQNSPAAPAVPAAKVEVGE